jgi:hypothetical protein
MNDLRFALRMLRKQPMFSVITVFTLALGIGATAAVFSLVQGVLLTPPPYREPERIVLIPTARADGQKAPGGRAWPAAQWMEWQKEAKSFEAVAAYSWGFTFLVRPEGSQSLEGMAVTRDYFRATGLQPVLGRTFSEREGGPGAAPVVILGYQLWQREFHGDPQVLGKPLRLGRRENPPTVIGVMPRWVRFLPSPGAGQEPNYNLNGQVDYWVPAIPDPTRLKNPAWDVVAKLRRGVTAREAQSELAVMVQREAQAERDFQGIVPRVQPLSAELNRDGERILFPLLGAAGAADCVRKRGRAVAGAGPATAAGVRGAGGAGSGPGGAVPAGIRGEFDSGSAGRVAGRGSGNRGGPDLPGAGRACHSTPGCGEDGLAGAGVGTGVRTAGSAAGRRVSGVARLWPERGGCVEGGGAKGQRGTRRTAATPCSDDAANGADAGAAGGCRAADPDHGEPVEGAVRLRLVTSSNDDGYGGEWEMAGLPSAGAGKGFDLTGRAGRGVRMGCATDGE